MTVKQTAMPANSINLDKLKRLAKARKKAEGIAHHEALDLVAQDLGYAGFAALRAAKESGNS